MEKKILFITVIIFLSLMLAGCNSHKYTIKWVNFDGEVLETDKNVKKGSIAEYNGAIPFRTSDDTYSYNFLHFRDSNNQRMASDYEITKNETFTAYFSRKELATPEKITYSWVNIGT